MSMESEFFKFIPASGPYIFSYGAGMAGAFCIVHRIKVARRNVKASAYCNSVLMSIAGFLAGFIAAATLNVIFELSIPKSLMHGIILGLAYPFLMSWIWDWLKENKPELARKLRVPRDRKKIQPVTVDKRDEDEIDLDDTHEGFF